jgi:hypothetical protein
VTLRVPPAIGEQKNFFSLQDRQVPSESLIEGVTRGGLTSGFARND